MQLRLRHDITLGLDLRGVLPARLLPMTHEEVARVTVWLGNRQVTLGELFHIDTGPGRHEGVLRIVGDLSKADHLGAEMTEGTLFIQGRVGHYAAQQMRGGTFIIHGHTGNNLAEGMRGGYLKVIGNVGDRAACPMPGEKRGMQGGFVYVQGTAGRELGHRMRRGTIAVSGDCGDYAGYEMLAGTIVVAGTAGAYAGLSMRRGTLVLGGNRRNDLAAGFQQACTFRPPMMPLLAKELEEQASPKLATVVRQTPFELYHGDLAQMGRGEILLPAQVA